MYGIVYLHLANFMANVGSHVHGAFGVPLDMGFHAFFHYQFWENLGICWFQWIWRGCSQWHAFDDAPKISDRLARRRPLPHLRAQTPRWRFKRVEKPWLTFGKTYTHIENLEHPCSANNIWETCVFLCFFSNVCWRSSLLEYMFNLVSPYWNWIHQGTKMIWPI